MKSRSIRHQLEFWSHLGKLGRYIHQYDGYTILIPKKGTWPRKIFHLHNVQPHQLKANINDNNLPKSIALDAEDVLNQSLEQSGFVRNSMVEGMTLEVSPKMRFEKSANITKVVDAEGMNHFATIASEAFGYNIHVSSLINLLEDNSTQIFIGKYKEHYVSCGILFLDAEGNSGLHMIGANKQYRGLGLGKEMTQHLLFHATTNESNKVHLVASKLGAPIYRKYGFTNTGHLNSYTF